MSDDEPSTAKIARLADESQAEAEEATQAFARAGAIAEPRVRRSSPSTQIAVIRAENGPTEK